MQGKSATPHLDLRLLPVDWTRPRHWQRARPQGDVVTQCGSTWFLTIGNRPYMSASSTRDRDSSPLRVDRQMSACAVKINPLVKYMVEKVCAWGGISAPNHLHFITHTHTPPRARPPNGARTHTWSAAMQRRARRDGRRRWRASARGQHAPIRGANR